MKATYIGNTSLPKDQIEVPDELEAFGVTFRKGEATDIPEEHEERVLGNPHFKVSGHAAGK